MVLLAINLSSPCPQYFSVPVTIVDYIIDNVHLELSQKLIKSCKTLKLIHMQKGINQIDAIIVEKEHQKFNFGPYSVVKESAELQSHKICITSKSLKVIKSLKLDCPSPENFASFTPKLDLSQTLKIDISIDYGIDVDILKLFLHPSVESLSMKLQYHEGSSPALLAFQNCPKMVELSVSYFGPHAVLTKKTINELIGVSRQKPLQYCHFVPVTEINGFDFILFILTHIKIGATFSLNFKNMKKYNEIKRASINIIAKRAGTFPNYYGPHNLYKVLLQCRNEKSEYYV